MNLSIAEARNLAVSASASIDGGDQVGYLLAYHATDVAIAKALQAGMAAVGVRNTWCTGMFSYFLERIARAGLAGMAAGNTWPRVAPHGGSQARLGTNPIAFGFPTESTPVIWDAGTAAMMVGGVDPARRTGTPLPDGVTFDRDRHPTTDPDEATEGAWAVWGGHKRSGLSACIQLLGMMTGAPAAPGPVRECGSFLLVIDPALLDAGGDYRARASQFVQALRGTQAFDPDRPARAPFERSAAQRAARLLTGRLDVLDAVCDGLRRIAARRPARDELASTTKTANR